MAMTATAAVCRAPGRWWELAQLELDEPHAGEVRIRFKAAGLCHSDDHVRMGSTAIRYPMVGGHEGAGIVDAVGGDVTRVAVGDHVVCSFLPVCGACRPCREGHQNLCDQGLNASSGALLDGSFRFHEYAASGRIDFGGMCSLGTFSDFAVVQEASCIPISPEIPFEIAALLSCGVPTGWGSAVYSAGVCGGETVVVFGSGGVGINAVQGARLAGAGRIVVVDPVAFKRDMALAFGATHVFEDAGTARERVVELTEGQLADHAIITVGVLSSEVIAQAASIIGKRGQVTVTSAAPSSVHAGLESAMLIGYEQRLHGALFGSCNPLQDVPRLVQLYLRGDLKLDELITRRYRLTDINDGYRDMLEGRNIRGVIVYDG